MNYLFLVAFQEGQAASPLIQFVPLILIFGIFWFLLIAPMRKRQKALQQLIENLKKGDRVITTGGLHGEVVAVREQVLTVKLAENLKVRVSKSAISGLQDSEES